MYKYEKRLQYPIDIKRKDLKMAKFIIAQYGGPHGEMGASTRYLAQRYTMPDERGRTLLTEIGTEAPEMFLSGANAFFDAFATV